MGVSKKFWSSTGVKLFVNWGLRRKTDSSRWIWALDQVNLTIPREGRWLGIVGANGSGKTTLLRILAGVTKPTGGTILVNGGVVPVLELFAGMQPELTGRENIYLNGILLGMRRREIQQKFDAIVDFAGVKAFLDMPVKHYSTGMMMRLGFSVAIHKEADIVLVDEAWSIGDVEFQTKSLERLRQLRQQGTALILVSHDLEIIRRHTEEALWLHQGHIASYGPPQQVIDAYLKAVQTGLIPRD